MVTEPGLRAADLVAVARRARSADGPTRDRAALEVVDAVACMRLGASHPIVAQVAAAGSWLDPGPYPSFAGPDRGLEEAVRLDALACHVDELDSIEPASAVVPAAVVVPAALHVALRAGSSGAALIDALLAGYDVLTLVGRALGGPAAYQHGWWPSSTVGALGAAAAVGLLLDLDDEQYAAAFGLAAARVGGLLSEDELGAGHYLAAADATVAGLRAALLAAGGLGASPSYLAGPARRAFASWRAAEHLAAGDGVRATIVKPFPCARPLQGVAAALLADGVSLEGIAEVVVELPAPLLRFVTTDVEVADATAAAASLAHVLAAVRAGRATDPRFFRAASLAGLPPVPSLHLRAMPDASAGSWACRVHLRTESGERRVLSGEPPLVPSSAVRTKAARTLADADVPEDVAASVLDDLASLNSCSDVRELRLHERLSARNGG